MESPLSFDSTENFRKKLITRNLKPFRDDGFNDGSKPGTGDLVLDDLSVIDSPQVEEIGSDEGNKLVINNLYGPDTENGKLSEPKDIDTFLTFGLDSTKRRRNPYFGFVPSTYSVFSLVFQDNPFGNNGSLSDDSDLARISATYLRDEIQYRVGQELRNETIGRINVLDPNNDAFDILSIATGNRDIIEKNWNISQPDSLIGKGLDFISRVTGVYSPYSWIQGDIFNYPERKSLVGQLVQGIGNLFSQRGAEEKDLSIYRNKVLLDSTGRGSKSVLFDNISFNKFVPYYNTERGSNIGLRKPQSNFYVGDENSDPRNTISPPNELPINDEGKKVQTAVRGYGVMGDLYEGNEGQLLFGLNGQASYDGGGNTGGFSWVGQQFKEQQGQNIGRGGEPVGGENDSPIGLGYSESTNFTFKSGSILDDTQKLVDAADQLKGINRLRHVGNAIDQVSKVFNDGTREMTKGSTVIRYEDENNIPKGYEYCRVFTKDSPFTVMGDLQKTEGNIRKFTSSVFNKTYDLSITPYKNEDVKKYMFSLENLSWRTSTKKGFTYQDLARCERGPNGGRIMWFPPYDMSVSETISANWNDNYFIGRPEPIYTYNNTTRQGNLSWKIIVDHPSVLNAIVDKELENNDEVNQIVDSFFAGCRKYDLYELALRYPEFSYSDLYEIIKTTNVIPQFETIVETTLNTTYPDEPEEPAYVPPQPIIKRQDFEYGFYFHNDVPGPNNSTSTTSNTNYFSDYNSYLALKNTYATQSTTGQTEPINTFFVQDVEPILNKTSDLVKKLREALEKGAEVSMTMAGSASAPNSSEYNLALSKRRVDSVKKYLLSLQGGGGKPLQDYVDSGKLTIKEETFGEDISITTEAGLTVNCTEPLTGSDKTFSVQAMACRRVKISDIVETYTEEPDIEDWEDEEEPIPIITTGQTEVTIPKPPKYETTTEVERTKEVAKKVVRKLLNECNYFERLAEDSPLVYDGIKDKIKYFNPAFHSMTPEGLNTRLTFLQQCMRPGETIPTIADDGSVKENVDVSNTTFGAPPVCILRIGDFFNTKIVINSININYEPMTFDLNPEGIGIQPMFANIQMSFNFIGGHGLQEPVARLQNALSFNYYANTEMYDERSDITAVEDSENLNAKVWEAIENQTPFGLNDRPKDLVSQEAGDTIGEILTTDIEMMDENSSNPGEERITGDIDYKNVVNDLLNNVTEYSNAINSSLEKVVNQYSISGVKMMSKDRKFTEGKITGYFEGSSSTTNIYGLPFDIQSKSDLIINGLLNDVDDETSPMLQSFDSQDFTFSEKRYYKKNLKNIIESRRSSWSSLMNSSVDDIKKSQQNLVNIIDKLNLVLSNTDGFRLKSGRNILYTLDNDDVNTVLNTDLVTVGSDLIDYYNKINDDVLQVGTNEYNNDLTFTLPGNTTVNTPPKIRFFMIFGYEVVNDTQKIIDEILGDLGTNDNWRNYVNNIIKGSTITVDPVVIIPVDDPIQNAAINNTSTVITGLKYQYDNIFKLSRNSVSTFQNDPIVKKITSYNPFNPQKERKFEYVKEIQNPVQKEEYFNILYRKDNSEGTQFNGKKHFN